MVSIVLCIAKSDWVHFVLAKFFSFFCCITTHLITARSKYYTITQINYFWIHDRCPRNCQLDAICAQHIIAPESCQKTSNVRTKYSTKAITCSSKSPYGLSCQKVSTLSSRIGSAVALNPYKDQARLCYFRLTQAETELAFCF